MTISIRTSSVMEIDESDELFYEHHMKNTISLIKKIDDDSTEKMKSSSNLLLSQYIQRDRAYTESLQNESFISG